MSDINISLIVHNYKGTERLKRCLTSILDNTELSIEIIVVDGLTNGIKIWMDNNFSNVKLLHFDKDEGIPARKNAAFSLVDLKSKYVVYMDEDIEVSKGWLSALVEVLEKNAEIGAAQPLMYNLYEKDRIDNAGCYLDYFSFPHKINYLFHNKPYEVTYAETATVIVRTNIIKDLPIIHKPFDIDYFVHWYDIDFSWLILLLGYKIVVVPSSNVYHERRLSSGSGRLPPINIFHNTKNRYYTMIKNYSLKNLVLFAPCILMLEITKVLVLLRGNYEHALATIYGISWIVCNLKKIIIKRSLIQENIRKVPDMNITKNFLKPNILRLYRNYKKNYL